MARGGSRPGAGRPSTTEKYGGHIAQAEASIADRLPELIGNLFRLAGGVKVYRPRKGDAPITDPGELAESDEADFYLTPPDRQANEYLINRIMGKPTERHEVTGEDGGPVQLDLTSLPPSELEALGRIAEQLAEPGPEGGPAGG